MKAKLGIAGTHSTGKSSLLDFISFRLNANGYSVARVSDLATEARAHKFTGTICGKPGSTLVGLFQNGVPSIRGSVSAATLPLIRRRRELAIPRAAGLSKGVQPLFGFLSQMELFRNKEMAAFGGVDSSIHARSLLLAEDRYG